MAQQQYDGMRSRIEFETQDDFHAREGHTRPMVPYNFDIVKWYNCAMIPRSDFKARNPPRS